MLRTVLSGGLLAGGLVLACHGLYDADVAALDQEVRLSALAATHQVDGGIGRMLDISNACAARGIQARHKLPLTSTSPWDAGCAQ
jgi:hypothetical protein